MLFQLYFKMMFRGIRLFLSITRQNSVQVLLIILVFSISLSVYSSGGNKIDSLKNILQSVPNSEKATILNSISAEYLSDSLEYSFEFARAALEFAVENKLKHEEAIALTNLGDASYFSNSMMDAVDYYQKSIDISIELMDTSSMSNNFSNLGYTYIELADYEQALESFNKSLEFEKALRSENKIAGALNNIGLTYDYLGKYKQSLEYYMEALQLEETFNNEEGISNVSNNIGNIYQIWGNYEKALFYYLKSLKIEENLESKIGIAIALNNIGIIYHSWKNYEKALDYYQQGLSIEEELDNKHGIAESLNNIAIIYDETGKYDKAIELYKKSLKIEEEVGNKGGISISLSNIGEFYADRGDYDKAFDYYNRSIKIDKEIYNEPGLGQTYNQLGDIYTKIKQYKKAIVYYNLSNNIVEPLNIVETITENYKGLGNVYSKIKDYKKAVFFINKHHALKDSIFSTEMLERQNNLYADFEIEKKEKEIELLNSEKLIKSLEIKEKQSQIGKQKTLLYIAFAGIILFIVFVLLLIRQIRFRNKAYKLLNFQNKEIKEKRIELVAAKEKAEESDRLKSAFLTTISHELRTPLNAIIGFSEFINIDTPKENIIDFVNLINSSGHDLYEIIEDILEITEMESGISVITKSKFPVKSIFDETVEDIETIQEKNDKNHLEIKLNFPPEAQDLIITSDKSKIEKALILVLRNAIKFTEEGTIEYGLEQKSDKIIFYIKDTGVGIPENKQDIVFDKFRQVDDSDTRKFGGMGLGLAFVKKIVESLDGKVWFDSVEGKGSTFYFSIPVIDE